MSAAQFAQIGPVKRVRIASAFEWLQCVATLAIRPGREWLRVGITALLSLILQRLWQRLLQRRQQIADCRNWVDSVDLENVQACLLTTVNLMTCGRIEKRTVMASRLSKIFTNSYIRDMVLQAAAKTTEEDPFVCRHLPMEDRWNVLVASLNHLSSLFGPYHLFSNQISCYESSWYVFTLVGSRTRGAGRFFITPQHPLNKDVGAMRVRLVLISEREIRQICSGEISTEDGETFSERHSARWNLMRRFAELFEKQLSRVTKTPQGAFDVRSVSWGNNLCGTVKASPKTALVHDELNDPYINNFLRIHVPVPLLRETQGMGMDDVVLYE